MAWRDSAGLGPGLAAAMGASYKNQHSSPLVKRSSVFEISNLAHFLKKTRSFREMLLMMVPL